MKSIRRTLRRQLLLGLTLLFAGLGTGLYFLIAELLENQLDQTVESRARLLASLVKQEPNGDLEIEMTDEPMPEFERKKKPEYFQLFGPGGEVLARSKSLGVQQLPRDKKIKARNDRAFFDVAMSDGRPRRAVILRFVPRLEHPDEHPTAQATKSLELVTTLDRSELDEVLWQVLAALAGAGGALFFGVALIVSLVVGRGLKPLAGVAERATGIDASSLNARFPIEGLPDELSAICQRLNDLLARLQNSFERERRFSSDVAHELRTPIAELRTLAEVALKFPDAADAATAGDTARDALDVAVLMERVVNNLLALARCEAGRQEIVEEPVDVGAAVHEAWRPFEARATERHLRASFSLAPVTVKTDRALLAAMLTNLFSNAVDHAPDGGDIACELRTDGDKAELAISNPAGDLDQTDLSHLFEPFWRKDAARTDRDHSGLGLTLVAAYAKLMGADAAAFLPEPGRFCVRLRLAAG